MSNSRNLLFAAARLDGTGTDTLERLAQSDLDWTDVIKGAMWQGVTPLVARSLLPISGVPEPVRRKLTQLGRVNAFRSLHLAAQIRTCLKPLQEHGLDAIPWKGPALAFDAYGDLTLRTSCDIDFLVRPGELSAARETLLGAGFTLEPENAVLTSKRLLRMGQTSGEVRLLGPDRSFLMELHEQFLHPTMANPQVLKDMWGRSLCANTWDGKPIRKLSVPDLLLTLCVHATKHGWDRLKWVIDIAAVLRKESAAIDWEQLLGQAEAYRLRGMLLIGLALAHRNARAEVPQQILQEIRSHAALKKIVEDQDRVYATDALPTIQLHHALRMRTVLDSFPRRTVTLLHEAVAVTSVDLAEFPASDRWLWLVPFYRPWRLTKRLRTECGKLGDNVWLLRAWKRLRDLPTQEKLFIVRAALLLLLVRVGLWILPFRQVLSLTERYSPPPVRSAEADPVSPRLCSEWIPRAARLIPRASCLTQAIAARWLLKSAGAQCELQVGVAKRRGIFSAHAVLVHEGKVVVGGNPLEQGYQRILSC